MREERQVQILWRWKAKHKPTGERVRWHFAAHGALWGQQEAETMAALLRSHGKIVKLLKV